MDINGVMKRYKIKIKNPVMGVPITFLDKYNPEQFEILDARNYTDNIKLQQKTTLLIKDKDGAINGKPTYARILIRHKK